MGCHICASRVLTASLDLAPKLVVRVRFPSPVPVPAQGPTSGTSAVRGPTATPPVCCCWRRFLSHRHPAPPRGIAALPMRLTGAKRTKRHTKEITLSSTTTSGQLRFHASNVLTYLQ